MQEATHLSFETELADCLAIPARLLRGSGGSQLDVVDSKLVEGFGNLNLLLRGEEGIGKLLALTKGALDDFEV